MVNLGAVAATRAQIPKLKLAHGEIHEEIQVRSGQQLLRVTVWSDKSGVDDTETIRTNLVADRINLLVIRVDRITRKVNLADHR